MNKTAWYFIRFPQTNIYNVFTGQFLNKLFLILLLSFGFQNLQAQQVEASIDSTSIKIGDQVRYTIQVETNREDLVVFPEGQTFAPMEMVEGFDPDTLTSENKFRLVKEYALTQFDSGNYTIPQQRILINDRAYLTDSLRVEVADVIVDTTRQKMYSIKPSVEVPKGFSVPNWIWWFLLILLIVGIGYYFFRRKKRKEAEAQLPPFEQAILELQELDNSHLLENRQTKEYYSRLTNAIRKYLDREIYDHALESTTSELVIYLENIKNSGKLNLDNKTIENLKVVLQRADLAKFANISPDIITAKEDRGKAEGIIKETKQAIPEPTEEELLRDEAYRNAIAKKKKRKKIIIAIGAGFLIIALGIAALIATKGYDYLVDTYFGNPTKDLLEGEWIQSEYGNPPVVIVTPDVLIREDIELPNDAKAMMVGNETFVYGSLYGDFYIVLTTLKLQQDSNFKLQTAVDGIYDNLENRGGKNIILKDEEFTTIRGVKGVKVFGTLNIENPVTGGALNNEYIILNFNENGGFQQIMLIYNEDDNYADEIANRIINSVEFNTPGN